MMVDISLVNNYSVNLQFYRRNLSYICDVWNAMPNTGGLASSVSLPSRTVARTVFF